MTDPGTLDALKDRLAVAKLALDILLSEAREKKIQSEVDRLTAKREGVQLALSYVRDEIALRDEGNV